jgi:transposase-like protein
MYVLIDGRWLYPWRAIDRNGEVLDILVRAKRDERAACKPMLKLLKKHGFAPRTIVTVEWRAYGAAFRHLGLTARHHQAKWKDNRIERSHLRVRRRERAMQGFRSPGSAQRFLAIHAAVYNHCSTRRHLISAGEHRHRRDHAFTAWRTVACAAA